MDLARTESNTLTPQRRGFAAMDPARRREISRLGGRKAHERGVAHRYTPEEARIAGCKGGKSVSRNREHMAEIGRRGGKMKAAWAARRRDAMEMQPVATPTPEPMTDEEFQRLTETDR